MNTWGDLSQFGAKDDDAGSDFSIQWNWRHLGMEASRDQRIGTRLLPDWHQRLAPEIGTRELEPDCHQIDQGIGTKESLCLDQLGLGVKLLLLDCHPGTGVLVSDEGDTLLNIDIGHHQTICSTIAMVSLLVEIHIPL